MNNVLRLETQAAVVVGYGGAGPYVRERFSNTKSSLAAVLQGGIAGGVFDEEDEQLATVFAAGTAGDVNTVAGAVASLVRSSSLGREVSRRAFGFLRRLPGLSLAAPHAPWGEDIDLGLQNRKYLAAGVLLAEYVSAGAHAGIVEERSFPASLRYVPSGADWYNELGLMRSLWVERQSASLNERLSGQWRDTGTSSFISLLDHLVYVRRKLESEVVPRVRDALTDAALTISHLYSRESSASHREYDGFLGAVGDRLRLMT